MGDGSGARAMPKKAKATLPNAAASALGVGTDRDKWTLVAVVTRFERRYQELIRSGTDADDQGKTAKSRLFAAQAGEIAQFLADYYQDNSREAEDYTRWQHRATRANSLAFRAKNQIAEGLHAGLSED